MAQSGPSQKVLLHISCHGLKNKDVLSKSDPMVIVFAKDRATGQASQEIGRTEVIKNCLDPSFVTPIKMDYFFEQKQELVFKIVDVDDPKKPLHDFDKLGEAHAVLGEIISKGNKFSATIQHGTGTLRVSSEEAKENTQWVKFSLRGENLDNKDGWFGKSDPYLVFNMPVGDGKHVPVHKTEVLQDTLNPVWPPFELGLATLANGDLQKELLIECYDWDKDGSHDLIGVCRASVAQLVGGVGSKTQPLELINPKKQAKSSKYKHSGLLIVDSCTVYQPPTFLDYLYGGCELLFTVAVDFTASNGSQKSPTSLHYINPSAPNAYQAAIMGIGDVLMAYDSDKLIPAYGFGAQLPWYQGTQFDFPLNRSRENPYCQGIPGVMQAYCDTLTHVTLYGPTNFAPIINHVANTAAGTPPSTQKYHVLLIITDGEITDMDETQAAIARAARLPMSIIIVGVGNANFNAMEVLDGDRLAGVAGAPVRDIVQFVAMRDYAGNPHKLAADTLAELPGQLVQYMRAMGVAPRPYTRTH
eukprot:Colp12_sorted_trinity150504_noHs@27058